MKTNIEKRPFHLVAAYSLYDKKSDSFNVPEFHYNTGVCMRQLHMLVNDGRSIVSHHPEDYVIYQVGTFDLMSGKLLPEEYPIEICQCFELKKKEE